MTKLKSGSLSKSVFLISIFLVVTIQPLRGHSCNGIPDEECDVLYALYYSTNGDQWTDSTNWLSSAPVNDWYGVRVEYGHVTTIMIGHNNLAGQIPAELGLLSSLEFLSLGGSGDNLTGSIPPELGDLSSLEYLSLSFIDLTGSIPPELGNLSNLEHLSLNHTSLTGAIPPELGNLSKLDHLNLSDNNLTGPIPPELGNLNQLRGLVLSSNDLTGEIPSELGNLSNLTFLSIENTNLTGAIPPELGNLSNLNSLNLYRNKLAGSIPPELENLSNLSRLNLYSNDLTGSIPPELGNLNSLEWADLSGNELSGSIPPELNNLSNLEWLDLSGNDLTESIPAELGSLPGLEVLVLNSNNLTGEIPPELGNLSSLKGLDLGRNDLTGEIPPELGNLSNLTHLYLRFNRLTGSIPPELGDLTNLQELTFQSNCLTGSIPAELGNLDSLGKLFLQSNCLSGDLPAFLAAFPYSMDLSWNCLYASDPSVLAAIENQHEGEFISTQTLAPENISALALTDSGDSENRVEVSWDPIAYTADPGGYQVLYRKTGDTEFKYGGMTHDKAAESFRVSNLEPGIQYEFMVNAVTWQHRYNKQDLYSLDSGSASAVSGTLARAFIPNWKQAPGYFTGVVAANFGDTDFDIDLAAYDLNGAIEPGGQNHQVINAGRQMSKLGSEVFHGNPYHEDFSWIELGAENSNRMGSIFLFGVSDTQMLDGAEAQSTYAKKLFFTRPLDEGFFAGWSPEFQMCIVNPTDEEVTVTCTIKGSNGESGNTHTIPARGFIKGDSEDLTNPGHGITDGYLEIEVTEGPGVVGFSRIEFPGVRTALGMNAVASSAARTMYSAQLAHGFNIVTNLRLVNTGGVSRNVTLTAVGDTGAPLADPVEVEIESEEIYSADLGTLFGLESEGVINTGSLVVESDGFGIIGDIIFADGDTLEYAMSLPLQDRLFKEAVFNHISNLPTIFTGFAFYNPGDATATVSIEAIGTDGTKVAEKTLILGPGERIARTLMDPDVWPEFPIQSGGYIKIQSDQPIAGQQLFGDTALRYMAAIPPTTRAEPMFIRCRVF